MCSFPYHGLLDVSFLISPKKANALLLGLDMQYMLRICRARLEYHARYPYP